MKNASSLPPFPRTALAAAATLLLGWSAPVMPQDPRPLLTWPDLIERPRPHADATLTYGRDLLQKVDLWLPAGAGRHPVVLMVHGGCWQSSIADRTLMDWIAADLRASGVAVWNIDYRGVDRPGGGYPGTFQDAARAADLLRENAARYRLDLSKVIAVGHSAGGHLALWLAARPRLPANSPLRTTTRPLPIARVVSLGGLPDLEATANAQDNGCGTEVIAKLVGPRPDPYADTSVPRLLPLGVPQDLVNGREDRIIPFRLATGYVAQARTAGDRVTLHTVPNTGHVELVAPESAAWAETKRLILTHLRPGSVLPPPGTQNRRLRPIDQRTIFGPHSVQEHAVRLSTQVKPISYVKANAAQIIEELTDGGPPMIITQNGEAKAVVQSIAEFERTQETLAFLQIMALADKEIAAGEVRPAREVLEELRLRYAAE